MSTLPTLEQVIVMEPTVRPSIDLIPLTGNQFVRYVDHYGGRVKGDAQWPAEAAWVSTKRGEDEPYENAKRVVNFCGRNDHRSVVYHSYITFDVYGSISTMRQFIKHRKGVERTEVEDVYLYDDLFVQINERSGRYVAFTRDDIFAPEILREAAPQAKQGSLDTPVKQHDLALARYNRAITESFDAYEELIELGVCREQARYVLPLGTMTYVRSTWSLMALMHFLKLRQEHSAQVEIQEFANAMGAFAWCLFPDTMSAFMANA